MARDMCVATAAVRLMLHYPFWCELYYTMKVVETYSIPTLATDGKRLWVNPTFFNELTLEYKIAALAHEVCHKMLHHCTRGRHHKMPWSNIAMDIVVNTLLHDNGFKIHPKWVQPEPKYKGWTYEAVYHDITKDLQEPPPQPQGGQGASPPPEEDDDQQEQPGGGSGEEDEDGDEEGEGDQAGAGGFCDEPGVPEKYKGAWKDVKPFTGSEQEVEAFEEKIEQQVQQAIATAKAMGNMPAGVEMAVEKVIKVAEEKWFDHLQRFFQSMRMAEYDWMKINRRMVMKHRVLAPTQYTERLGPCVIFNDASGSCYSTAVQSFFSTHMNAILAEARPSKLYVAHFDTIVHKCDEIDLGEYEVDSPPKGGGGTDFTDLFPYLEREGIYPDVVVILTDMYGTFPQEEPGFPVIWASTSKGVVAPIGETIYIGGD